MVVNIVDRLQELGLSEYEARAYVALLREHPATAYETARRSGIPSSKIYQVIDRLEAKRMAVALAEGERVRYVPAPAQEFLSGYRERMEESLHGLGDELSRLETGPTLSAVWNLAGEESFRERTQGMVRSARKTILLSAWDEELRALEPVLHGRERKGVKIAIVRFGPSDVTAGKVFAHPIEDTLYSEKGGRGFTLVADGREALVATFAADGRVEGAWSANTGFVTLAEDYVKHDIYIMKIVRRFDRMLVRTFGTGYGMLRDVFEDEEIERDRRKER